MLKIYYLKISDCNTIPEVSLLKRIRERTREEVVTFKNVKVRRLKCLGEIMVSELIEKLWQIQAKEYSIVKAKHGKPYIQMQTGIFYNLSHSGNYMVCALSDREVGIDIQQMGTYKFQIAERFFHQNEIQTFVQCDPKERANLFYRYWAAKESFLKYTGTGLSVSLSDFEIRFEEKQIQIFKPDLEKKIYLQDCIIDPDYKCMVCSEYADIPEIYPFVFTSLQ